MLKSLLIKPMRRTRRIGPIRPLTQGRAVAEVPMMPRGPRLLETAPQEVQYWMRVISRERAMRAWRLKQRLGQLSTLPELLTYEWLERRPHQFSFQSSLAGGRLVMGGAVADFIIFDLLPDGLAVWRIQGDYWHTRPQREEKDQQQKEKLLTEWYMGLPVMQVTDCWESSTYWRAPEVWEKAEVGEELGRTSPMLGRTL